MSDPLTQCLCPECGTPGDVWRSEISADKTETKTKYICPECDNDWIVWYRDLRKGRG